MSHIRLCFLGLIYLTKTVVAYYLPLFYSIVQLSSPTAHSRSALLSSPYQPTPAPPCSPLEIYYLYLKTEESQPQIDFNKSSHSQSSHHEYASQSHLLRMAFHCFHHGKGNDESYRKWWCLYGRWSERSRMYVECLELIREYYLGRRGRRMN